MWFTDPCITFSFWSCIFYAEYSISNLKLKFIVGNGWTRIYIYCYRTWNCRNNRHNGCRIRSISLNRKQNEPRDEILTEIIKITKNQAKIIESLDIRRRKNIDWLIHHVDGVLQSPYRMLSKVDKQNYNLSNYHIWNRSQHNTGEIEICRMFLIKLKWLA